MFANKWPKVTAEAVTPGCSIKKVFLEISENSQENTCGRASASATKIYQTYHPRIT